MQNREGEDNPNPNLRGVFRTGASSNPLNSRQETVHDSNQYWQPCAIAGTPTLIFRAGVPPVSVPRKLTAFPVEPNHYRSNLGYPARDLNIS
jgi:hypothetical protein